MDIPNEHFLKIKHKAEEVYKAMPEVYCPYFKDKVQLNAKGLDHIKNKKWNKPRSRWDQYLRFKLLYLMPEILKQSHTLQGIWQTHEWERQKRHGIWEKRMKRVTYYEFIAVIGKSRIKIIVKEIEGGLKYFWSIIPFWKTNNVTQEKVLHEGNLEND